MEALSPNLNEMSWSGFVSILLNVTTVSRRRILKVKPVRHDSTQSTKTERRNDRVVPSVLPLKRYVDPNLAIVVGGHEEAALP